MPLTPESHDLLLAFDLAPVGLLVARQRRIHTYNQAFCDIFGYAPHALRGESLQCLYPTVEEFQHTGVRALTLMKEQGTYSDDRIMRKGSGDLFWCHVTGRTERRDDPFAAAVWVFEDISAVRPVTHALTAREREVAQLMVQGKSSKHIAQELGIGYRTVEAHRARLMRKYEVTHASELVARLMGGG